MTKKTRIDISHTRREQVRPDEITFRQSLGKVIHEKRIRLSLTGKQASEKSLVSNRLISECENGKVSPDSYALIRLMENLDFRLSDLGIAIGNKSQQDSQIPQKISLKEITKQQFTKIFSEALANRRRELGESQVDLAEKLETTQSAVSRWEHGTETPRSMMFIRLMKVLQFDPFGIAKAKR